MKKNLILALCVVLPALLLLASCKKSNVPVFVNNIIVTDSVLYSAALTGGELGDIARGNVSVEKQGANQYLVFKNFSSSNGPAVYVYLSKTIGSNASPASEFINLGGLKATSGTFNYQLTNNPDLSVYKYVLVWCEQFKIQFGYAKLRN